MEMELQSTTFRSRTFILEFRKMTYNPFEKSVNEFLLLFQSVSMKTGLYESKQLPTSIWQSKNLIKGRRAEIMISSLS